MFVILLLGVLYCATGQPYQRVWSADWDEIPDAIGGHVKYENGSFGFKGYGWVDKNKDWEVGTNFNWRFRRALQKMSLKKVCLKNLCTNYLGIQTIMSLRVIPTPWKITLVERYASPASDFLNGGFMLNKLTNCSNIIHRDCGAVVVERREVLGSIPTKVTVLCPWARHINSLQYWLNPGRVGSVRTWLKHCWLGR